MAATAPEHPDRGPVISVRLLNGFPLWVSDQSVPVMPSSQRLLAYLALRDGSVTRTALAGALWPDMTERRAAACLRSALWRLVKPPHSLVAAGGTLLEIDPAVEVDVALVRRFAADLARSGKPERVVPVATLTADLLPGWDDPWVSTERE